MKILTKEDIHKEFLRTLNLEITYMLYHSYKSHLEVFFDQLDTGKHISKRKTSEDYEDDQGRW